MNQQKVTNIYLSPLVITPEWTAYVILPSILAVPCVFGFFATLKITAAWPTLAVPLFMLILFLLWIGGFKIYIRDEKIIYKTLFSKKEMLFADVQKIKIAIGVCNNGRINNSAYYNLNIIGENQELMINMKPFSRRGLATIVDSLCLHNSNIELDDFSKKLREGDVKPIINEGIKQFWKVALWLFVTFLIIGLVSALRK
jgi:hypothetical protein